MNFYQLVQWDGKQEEITKQSPGRVQEEVQETGNKQQKKKKMIVIPVFLVWICKTKLQRAKYSIWFHEDTLKLYS